MNVKFANLNDVEKSLQLQVRCWRNANEVQKLFIVDEIPLQVHKEWLKNTIATGKDVAFITYADNQPVGLVYLRKIDNLHKNAEYGIFLKPGTPRNTGLGFRASSHILDYAFHQLGLEKVYLEVFASNSPAIALYKKLGFQGEGILRKHVVKSGERVDLIRMGILKNEWEQR